MGHEVLYCVGCGARLLSADFDKNRAFRINEMPYCKKCAPAQAASKPAPAAAPAPQPRVVHTSQAIPPVSTTPPKGSARTTAVRVPHPSTPRTQAPRFSPAPPPSRETTRTTVGRPSAPSNASNKVLLFCLLIAGFVIFVIIVALATRSKGPASSTKHSDSPSSTPKTTNKSKKGKPPQANPAMVKSLEEARVYRKTHPGDLIGQLEKYDKAMWDVSANPSLLMECKSERNKIQAVLQKQLDVELDQLESEITAPLGAQDFNKALEILEKARHRHNTQLWILGVDKKIGRVKDLQYEAGL